MPEQGQTSPEREPALKLTDLVRAEEQAAERAAAARTQALAELDGFRHTPVLVPLDEQGGLWSADEGGIRWIMAFSDEEALAEFALARGDGAREWEYRRILGSRLLDAVVPAMPVPCGVALDAASDYEEGGRVFPPVMGIVPDRVAVDTSRGAS